jgi:hypothetical protein
MFPESGFVARDHRDRIAAVQGMLAELTDFRAFCP